MPSPLTAPENRDASLRAQAASARNFALASPPEEPRALELWMQHAAGFILFERVRAAGLAILRSDVPNEVRSAVELAVDATLYALMSQMDGVSEGLGGNGHEIELTFGVTLRRGEETLSSVDLREGDGMCMGFHGWVDGDFGDDAVVVKQ
jgi:hypothetical protein